MMEFFWNYAIVLKIAGGGNIKNIYLDPIVNGVDMMNLETAKLL